MIERAMTLRENLENTLRNLVTDASSPDDKKMIKLFADVIIKMFTEMQLNPAHQEWVSEVVGRLEGLKSHHQLMHSDGTPCNDTGINTGLDAAISAIQSTTKGE